MQYTVLQPVAVFSAEGRRSRPTASSRPARPAPTAEKQLFDCLLITKDNVDKYTGPFTLKQ